jgi:hypothetical protein
MAAVKMYGITIHIYEKNSEHICLAIEKNDDKQDSSFEPNYHTEFKTICSLNVRIGSIECDGNCYFRALRNQILGSQDRRIVL